MQIVCFTIEGKKLAQRIQAADSRVTEILYKGEGNSRDVSLHDWVGTAFANRIPLVFIGACGIAVRHIAPFIDSKMTDPPVIVMDEAGKYVIPILSSHMGGGGDLARELAELIGAEAVLTTASDVKGMFAADEYARRKHLTIPYPERIKQFASAYQRLGKARLKTEAPFVTEKGPLPTGFTMQADEDETLPELYLGVTKPHKDALWLCVPCIYIGMGCRKGKSVKELGEYLAQELKKLGIPRAAIVGLYSADAKKEEEGLILLAEELGLPFGTFDSETLMQQAGDFTGSEFVKQTIGTDNVCERAIIAAGADGILLRKTAKDGMTLAIGYKTYVAQNWLEE